MKKILFVTYGGGHARMLKPVIIKLQEKRTYDISILALNTANAELSGLGAVILGYHDFFLDDPDVQKYGKELVKTLDKVVDYDESVAYLGANYKELVDRYGRDSAATMYAKGGRYIFEPKDTMEEILSKLRPDVLVTTNSPRSERFAVVAAKRLKIRTVAFIDMFGIRCSSWFKDVTFGDKIFVLSESVKQRLVNLGRSSDQVIVTGNPSFDRLVKSYESNKYDILNSKKNMPFTVLWASQPEPSLLPETGEEGDVKLPEKIEKVLVEIFRRNNNWRLIARNHPSEAQRCYPSFVQFSTQQDSFDDLLRKVHVVLTPSSTVGFQGIIMGTKLVTLDLSVLTPTMPYAEMGYSIGLKSLDDIESTLNGLFLRKDENYTPPYSEQNAAGRAVEEIEVLLQESLPL